MTMEAKDATEGQATDQAQNETILFHRVLRPHQAISVEGQKMALRLLLFLALFLAPGLFVFIGAVPENLRFTGAMILFGALLSPVPFLFLAFRRRNRDGKLKEIITITERELHLERFEPNGRYLEFVTDPYWVKIEIEEKGVVENYVTLRDQKRHVEIGAFLSPWERKQLYADLIEAQKRVKRA